MIVFLGLLVAALLTQVGGLVFLVCWIANRIFLRQSVHGWRRVASNIALFIGLYAVGSMFLVPPLAERIGRVPLPCFEETGRLFAAGNFVICALNRHYVDRRLADLLTELSRAVDKTYPGTSTLFLDANFPLIAGFPLLPHLSHYDGRKLDIAYYYATPTGSYLRGQLRSPIGYWAFEQPASNDNLPCDDRSLL